MSKLAEPLNQLMKSVESFNGLPLRLAVYFLQFPVKGTLIIESIRQSCFDIWKTTAINFKIKPFANTWGKTKRGNMNLQRTLFFTS